MKESLGLYKSQRVEFVKLIKELDVKIERMRNNAKQYPFIEQAMSDLRVMRKFIHDADRLAIVANTQNNEVQDVIIDYEEEIEKWKKVVDIQTKTEPIKLKLL